MLQASRRTGSPDSALVRLLARLAELEGCESPQNFANRLSQWLRWTDATPLFNALQAAPAPRPPARAGAAEAAAAASARLRGALAQAIAEEVAAATAEFRAPPIQLPGEPRESTPGFAPYRRCCLARQSAMAAGIEPLRGRLRLALAARSPALARLAGVDAVLEQVVGAQEHRLLAGVPRLLEKRFGRLRAGTAPDGGDGWILQFQQELQGVLLAELELRWQPIEGLLAALRSHQGGARAR
ncbi:DUF3348 family protein [Pseudorhodoferax sp.]|uniref:DUF3348 family protein n=1 Tax=Pseudorhodoferax sp. TaxID=1993553 RepID=UPI0039E53085